MWKNSQRFKWTLISSLVVIFLMSCTVLDTVAEMATGDGAEDGPIAEELTLTAEFEAQMQTSTAEPLSQPFLTQTELAENLPQETATPTPTENLAETPVVALTYTQTVVFSPTPSNTPLPTTTPLSTSVPLTLSEEKRFQEAKILVLEDIAGDPILTSRLDTVLSNMGLTGDNVINVHDATGKFVQTLKSDETWDLIIVATEKRTEARLDIWEPLLEHVENGGALIIEAYYLDEIEGGTIQPLLGLCGVHVHVDWNRKLTDKAYSYVVYDIARNNHRLFNQPNKVNMPLIPAFYWAGDVGDLMEILPISGGHLVGGLHIYNTVQYGLITECIDGRMVIQSFSTHNYKKVDMLALWENYIANTLLSHFRYLDTLE